MTLDKYFPFTVLFRPSQIGVVAEAAKILGKKSTGEFVRDAALEKAAEVVKNPAPTTQPVEPISQ